MNDIQADKVRVSAPLTMLVAAVMAAFPIAGVYYSFQHRIESLEAQRATDLAAITALQVANIQTDKTLAVMTQQFKAMLESQQKVESFIEELRNGRYTVRAAGGRRQ